MPFHVSGCLAPCAVSWFRVPFHGSDVRGSGVARRRNRRESRRSTPHKETTAKISFPGVNLLPPRGAGHARQGTVKRGRAKPGAPGQARHGEADPSQADPSQARPGLAGPNPDKAEPRCAKAEGKRGAIRADDRYCGAGYVRAHAAWRELPWEEGTPRG